MVSRHRIGSERVEELVLARIDRALDTATEDALDRHLRTCQACTVFATRQERLHASVRALAPAHVDTRDRERIWVGIAARRRARRPTWPRVVGQLALAAVVLLVAVLAGVFVVQSRSAAPVPAREIIATRTSAVPGGTATLSVIQGSTVARAGWRVGVGVEATLDFQAATAGSAEVRFRPRGDPAYGILGAAPDLAGVTRATFGGAVPRPSGSQPVTYEIWLHLETGGGTIDTDALLVQVTATRDGERAEPR